MAPPTTKLSPSVADLVERYRLAVESSGIPVKDVIIFGSQTKGTARSDSDIDVAVVSPSFGRDRFEERLRLMGFGRKFMTIEPHPLHPIDLQDQWSSFIQEVKTHGVSVPNSVKRTKLRQSPNN